MVNDKRTYTTKIDDGHDISYENERHTWIQDTTSFDASFQFNSNSNQ